MITALPHSDLLPNSSPHLPYGFAKRHGVLIDTAASTHSHIKILHLAPLNAEVPLELRRFLQCPLQLQEISAEEFQQQLTHTYQTGTHAAAKMMQDIEEELDLEELKQNLPKTEDLLATQDEAPIIRFLNALFTQAIRQKASDIHLETYEQNMLIRFRLDGLLQEILEVQRALAPSIISRIKVMAKLDIAEKRVPQDGRVSLQMAGHLIDVRVSTLPSNHGERIVLRLLDQKAQQLDLTALGMPQTTKHRVEQLLAMPHGIILVTGPTGSGKTTTLYAMLSYLNESSRNILTIEDPIEYDLPGIGQTQVNAKVNLTFAKGLRAILRQDPDIVMIGEIRDAETAEIAVQASLTGHLVLATLHTNTAIGAIMRLREMGIESFLLASSLIGLMAQRLVRKLCAHCKQPLTLDLQQAQQIGCSEQTLTACDFPLTIYQPQGCASCSYTGYSGRTSIYEFIALDETLRDKIHHHAAEQDLEQYLRQHTPSIRQDGFTRVIKGETSLAEVLRVTSEE